MTFAALRSLRGTFPGFSPERETERAVLTPAAEKFKNVFSLNMMAGSGSLKYFQH